MEPLLNRRKFMQVSLFGGAVLLLPSIPVGCGDTQQVGDRAETGGPVPVAGEGRFFNLHQYETINAVTGVIIPEDEDPGAVSAGVVDYIDFLLGAFKVDPPRIYAAGPFSGRHGGENGFTVYLPLSRVKEIAWRTHIEGSQGIPEREFNGPVEGLQEIYENGVDQLDTLAQAEFGPDFKDLEFEQQKELFNRAEKGFRDVAFNHTVEGTYAAPEYGGNRDLVGWKYIHYEGDRQPVGYTRRQVEEPDEEYAADRLSPQEVEEAAKILQTIVLHGRTR